MRQEQGVALITVLLIVAIVTAVCAGIIARQQVSVRQGTNQFLSIQAQHYALGGEMLAQAILNRDLEQQENSSRESVDHLGEAWAKPVVVYNLDRSTITVRIEDLAGRFNLNSLVQGGRTDPLATARFRRLLVRLGMDPNLAEQLARRLTKGETAVDNASSKGLGLLGASGPPEKVQELSDVSEIRQLPGMNEAGYRKLGPYVAALPAKTALNVNTASAMVLTCLADRLDLASARALVDGRGSSGYRTLHDFLGQQALAGAGVSANELAVGSQFFMARVQVGLSDRQQTVSSLLFRDKDHVSVLRREIGVSMPSHLDDGTRTVQ